MADDQREEDQPSNRTRHTDRQERGPRQQDEGRRSRSPRKDDRDRKPRRKDAGFKWKEKRRDDNEDRRDQDSGLRRGYRDHYRPKSRSRSPRPRSSERRERDRDRDNGRDQERRRDVRVEPEERSEKKPKIKEKKSTPATPQQPMIIVYVNDRLGTKKAVPCFATDPIKDFKVIVASMIGRRPHEILLKRQGERPFKDQLTLQDYGITNNVQIDLEVDTGD